MDQTPETQLLTAVAGDTLTGTHASSSKTIRMSSKASLQVELLYVCGETAGASKYFDCYLELTNVPDTEGPSGPTIPADASWHPYKEEVDDGAGGSTFIVRHWQIYSQDATLQVDLSAVFSRPIFANRARLKVKEFGVSSFGTIIAKASTKSI